MAAKAELIRMRGNVNDLTSKVNELDEFVRSLSQVATTGAYNDLNNKPDFKPVAVSGKYGDLTEKPDLKSIAISGQYSDLIGKPTATMTGLAYEGGHKACKEKGNEVSCNGVASLINMGDTLNGNRLCFLSATEFIDYDKWENADTQCKVYQDGGKWYLQAVVPGGNSRAECGAICMLFSKV